MTVPLMPSRVPEWTVGAGTRSGCLPLPTAPDETVSDEQRGSVCPARTGPIWKLDGEACGCTLPEGHENEPPTLINGIGSRDHQCGCGSWWVDSIRRDRLSDSLLPKDPNR